MKTSPITIKDIAKLVGVSVSTVSRALKDHPDISQETKDAIKSVAASLHYRPSQVAVSLRLKKSKVIAVLLPKIYSFFFPTVVNGIEEVANQYGYHLMILQSNESYLKEVENTNILLTNNIAGVLAAVSRQTKDFQHFQNVMDSGIPIVFFDRVPGGISGDMVLVDDASGAYEATKHLIERGKKRIAICIGNRDLLISINRLNGYKQALKDFGIPFYDEYIVSAESPDEATEKAAYLLDLPVAPDSIFAISGLTMSGIIKEVYRRKIKIPKELSLIGFCEDTFCELYNPQLSAILPMGYETGKRAAEKLFEKILEDKDKVSQPETIMLKSKLVIRDSS